MDPGNGAVGSRDRGRAAAEIKIPWPGTETAKDGSRMSRALHKQALADSAIDKRLEAGLAAVDHRAVLAAAVVERQVPLDCCPQGGAELSEPEPD